MATPGPGRFPETTKAGRSSPKRAHFVRGGFFCEREGSAMPISRTTHGRPHLPRPEKRCTPPECCEVNELNERIVPPEFSPHRSDPAPEERSTSTPTHHTYVINVLIPYKPAPMRPRPVATPGAQWSEPFWSLSKETSVHRAPMLGQRIRDVSSRRPPRVDKGE